MRLRRRNGRGTQDAYQAPATSEPTDLPTAEDDTEARWEPIPDEVWFTSPADRPVASDANGIDAGLDLPDLRMPSITATSVEPVTPEPAAPATTTPAAATPPQPSEPAADRTQLVSAGEPYRVARPAGATTPDGATVRREPAASPAPDTPGRTQVWAAPYAGMGGGYDDAAPDATATARRPSLLRRNRTRRQPNDGVGQIPYDGSADGPRGPYDGSPVPLAEGGRAPRRRWRDRKPARHGCLSLLLWLVMLGVVALMALRTLPSHLANGRMVPELVAFVPWLFAPIIVCLVLALLWRRRLLAVCCAAALAVMAWWHAGFFVPTARVSQEAVATVAASASTEDNAARVMTVNTNNGMASAREIVEICREQNVEILCLQELGGSMLDDLEAAGIDEVLPYHVVSDEATQISNGGRNGIWSAAPMGNVSTNLLPIETSSMPAADVTVGGRVVRVVSVHPNSPVRGAQDLWDEGLATIGQLQGYDHAYLIMGDFNSTWDHARFRELLGTSFVDAGQQSGEGFHMTFPSEGPVPPAVELDHIVYARDSGIVVSELETRHVSGTDHMALLGTLEAQ